MNKNASHTDVIIVGAGLSGIGAAHYLQAKCPNHTFTILEMRDAIGGTWDLFRYPGIRSDSDMFTFGYAFRPWKSPKAIADGPSILTYIRETAEEENIVAKIKFKHRVRQLNWSSETSTWHVKAVHSDTNETVHFSCNFILMCSGYYSYDEGYTPDFPGREQFKGKIVHPQKWTDDIDYTDKKVVVIGSGATAVTLVPEMAKKASLVTMLQRSPTYIASAPAEDVIAKWAIKSLPSKTAYKLIRWKNILWGLFFFKLARKQPKIVKSLIRKGVEAYLGKDYALKHFMPKYNPWDQRLCLVPDGDLFEAIKAGKAEMVTDHIETFTQSGIKLKSGKELGADLIVTATGLKMELMSGQELLLDGEPVNTPDHFVYRGMMLNDIPNFAFATGYTNASWTLKSDLSSEYFCRLLNYMKETEMKQVTPKIVEGSMEAEPLIDFNSSYIMRAAKALPKQGSKRPWKLHQNYPLDILNFRYSSIKDKDLEFK